MLTLYIADVERDAGMKKLSREEAAKVLEGMKVKIEIPKAAVTQWKRNAALDMAIEMLNCSEIPNGSDDTISRQMAIDAICAICGNDCDKSEFVYNAPQTEQVILCPEHYALSTLPSAQPEVLAHGEGELIAQPEQRWIPVSERLPEVGHVVLWCNEYGSVFVSEIVFANEHSWYIGSRHRGGDPIAWMPLPEPYRGGEQDDR